MPAWPVLVAQTVEENAGSKPGALGIVYDNSSSPAARAEAERAGWRYAHDPRNGGTAAAYAFAASVALERGHRWLLVLDHDTAIPPSYAGMVEAATRAASDDTVGAFVPSVVVQGGKPLSPARVTRTGSLRPLGTSGAAAPPSGRLTAVASGTVFRVSALASVLPYPQRLWLDYVDHWTFARLHDLGHRLCILPAVLVHDLSIASPKSLSRARLESILEGESIFVRALGRAARFVHPLRLASRVARYVLIRPVLAGWVLRWLFRKR